MGQPVKQLSPHDTVMLIQDGPRTPNQMGPLFICDQTTAPQGRVTFTDVLEGIEARLHLAPALRRKLARVPFGLDRAYWVDDDDFDLEFHVRQLALPQPGDWRQLCIQSARLFARPLDLTRPPWELYVIEGLNDLDGVPPGSFGVLMKIHHSMIDGTEGAQLVTILTGAERDPQIAPPRKTWRGKPAPSTVSLLGRSLLHGYRWPAAVAGLVREALPAMPGLVPSLVKLISGGATVPITRFNGPVSPHRVVDGLTLPFEEIRRVKRAVPGATINDVALSIVAGGLRRYLSAHEELPELSLVAAVPISTRAAGTEGQGGNQIDGARVPIRTDIDEDLPRLAAIAESTTNIRDFQNGVGLRHLAQMTEVLPGGLLGTALRSGNVLMARTGVAAAANCVVTNVPGPLGMSFYFLGAEIVQSYGAGPLLDGLGLFHLIGTYGTSMLLSVTACRLMLPDPEFYVACLRETFDSLAAAA